MKTLTNIKDEFQREHADQLAEIRSDMDRLGSDLTAFKNDLLDNKLTKKRLKKWRGSERWSQRLHIPQIPSNAANPNLVAGAAIAGALVIAAGAFAIWSSRPSEPSVD